MLTREELERLDEIELVFDTPGYVPDFHVAWLVSQVRALSAQVERLERVLAAEDGSHLIRVTDSGEIGMTSGRKRHRVECLTCGVVLHESTTGHGTWVKMHIAGQRCPYERPMTDAEQALRGGE